MALSKEGYCTACKGWVLDYPHLMCPWCSHPRTAATQQALGLSQDADPFEVLTAAEAGIVENTRERHQLLALRSKAAHSIIQADDLPAAARRAHHRIATLERWGTYGSKPKTCDRGHLRSEHGYRRPRGWGCRACDERRRAEPKPAPLTAEQRNDPTRLDRLWAEHERRLAERERMLAADPTSVPAQLAPPLPPPPQNGQAQ